MALPSIGFISTFLIHCAFWQINMTNGIVAGFMWNQRDEVNNTELSTLQELSSSAVNFLLLQNINEYHRDIRDRPHPVMVTIGQPKTWVLPWPQQIHDHLLKQPGDLMFLNFVLEKNTTTDTYDIHDILRMFEAKTSQVHTVFMFVSDNKAFAALARAVCSSRTFKWTSLIHETEWVLATADSNKALNLSGASCFDFFTYICASEGVVCISRKSRGRNVRSGYSRSCKQKAWSTSDIATAYKDVTLPKAAGLEGMKLPVGILHNLRKYSFRETNSSKYTGYAMELLDLLATALKFEYTLVIPTDEGEYGAVLKDGSATGLTGMVARKEIALSTMGFSRTENRLQAIDYVDTPELAMPIYLTYKLPQMEQRLDLTLLDIIQADFLIMLLGPALIMAVIGVFVHISTQSCRKKAPRRISKQDLRRVTSFPDHVCFHSTRLYAGQTGRILRASWALFWVVISAAYSAYLVTSFTVKPRELQLNSLQKLLKHPEYRIGSTQLHSALQTYMETSNDPVIQNVWQRIEISSYTDPFITAPDRPLHMRRSLDGNYAFLDLTNSYDIPTFTGIDITNHHIRSYYLPVFKSLEGGYVVLPKKVFYKHALEIAMMTFEESGVLRFLQEKYSINHPPCNNKVSNVKKETSVHFSRITVLVFVTLGCIVTSVIGLIIEVFCTKSRRRFSVNIQSKEEPRKVHWFK